MDDISPVDALVDCKPIWRNTSRLTRASTGLWVYLLARELHVPAPYVILICVNQETPNPLNYANPIAAPGVEVLSDGTNGIFHCRINPSRISYSQKRILISLGAIHLGILLLAISFIMFRSIGGIVSHLPGLLMALTGIIALGYGLIVILYYAAGVQPHPFEYIADEHQLVIGFNGKMLSPIPVGVIQDLWIKRFVGPFENYLWILNIFTRDKRFITYHISAPQNADLSAHEPILRKILGITEVSNRNFIVGRRFHEITEGNTHEHPNLSFSNSPAPPLDTTTWKIGLSILADGTDGTFHCILVSSTNPRKPQSVEFIADAEQLTIIANGASRETFPRSQFREIAFRRKHFPPTFTPRWLLRIRWNDDLVFEFRFKVPRKVDFKPCAITMVKLLHIPDGCAIGLLPRPDYRLVPRAGVFDRERVNTN